MIDRVIAELTARLAPLEAASDPRRYFHATYLRTTVAVAAAVERGQFTDPAWVGDWDVAFAGLYLDALQADPPALPWAIAFDAPPALPALRHVLLGMNAHINYDLPQALLAVIAPDEFDDPAVLARREADHQVIDEVLAARIGAEDDELSRLGGSAPLLDRVLRPASRTATRRFLRESRRKVWANAVILDRARRQGPDAYAAALGRLAELSAAKVTELRAPGQVLLRLAVRGFGVSLTAADSGPTAAAG